MTKIFTKEMKDFLKENVKGITSADLTTLINNKFNTQFTVKQIRSFKDKQKLSSGLGGEFGRFKSGQIPWNKGKKMSEKLKEKIRQTKTMFEVGHVHHQTLPLGTERLDKDGYVEIKVTASDYESANNRGKSSKVNTKWIGKHTKIWIDNYGDVIPPHSKIIFKDKNKYNFDINNLAVVLNSEHATMNLKRRYSEFKEITETNLMLTKLEKAIKNKQKALKSHLTESDLRSIK